MRTVLCDFQVNYNEKQDIPRFQDGGDHSFFSVVVQPTIETLNNGLKPLT